MTRIATEGLAAQVMADETLAAQLARIEDAAVFIARVRDSAQAHELALSEAPLPATPQPDSRAADGWPRSPHVGSGLPPRHWLPHTIVSGADAVFVDWAWFGPEPLRMPFYADSVRQALRLPFNRAFPYRTRLQDLVAQAGTLESLAPNGFIFHMSRCGSTLVAQMLAALSDSIVISEAAPIDAVVQLARGLSTREGASALRAIIAAFGRRRRGDERRFFIKLDCWHTLALPLFHRAFPKVPWVFLYRDPVEVLVSQMRQRGMQMVPSYYPPSFYGIDAAGPVVADEDYCARVLAAVCQAVLDHHALGDGLLIDYRQLPQAVGNAVLPHFGIPSARRDRGAMLRTAERDAKTPGLPFAADAEAKQRAATEAVRRAAGFHLGAIYCRLGALRAPS